MKLSKHLEECKAMIDAAVTAMNNKLFGANWKQVSECSQNMVYAQVEINRAIFENDKYRWHDLRKNPEDMPEDFKLCIVLVDYSDGKEYGIGYACEDRFIECHSFDGYSIGEAYLQHKDVEVVAWRYVEPYEGEE